MTFSKSSATEGLARRRRANSPPFGRALLPRRAIDPPNGYYGFRPYRDSAYRAASPCPRYTKPCPSSTADGNRIRETYLSYQPRFPKPPSPDRPAYPKIAPYGAPIAMCSQNRRMWTPNIVPPSASPPTPSRRQRMPPQRGPNWAAPY